MGGRLLPTGKCFCGCGLDAAVGKFFLSSHDRKAEAAVIALVYGSVAAFLVAHGYGPGRRNAHLERERAQNRPAGSSKRSIPPKSAGTTTPGYRNPNDQVVVRKTDLPGTDHLQKIYVLRCERPEHARGRAREYGANGSDIHLRRCPTCQGGREGLNHYK